MQPTVSSQEWQFTNAADFFSQKELGNISRDKNHRHKNSPGDLTRKAFPGFV